MLYWLLYKVNDYFIVFATNLEFVKQQLMFFRGCCYCFNRCECSLVIYVFRPRQKSCVTEILPFFLTFIHESTYNIADYYREGRFLDCYILSKTGRLASSIFIVFQYFNKLYVYVYIHIYYETNSIKDILLYHHVLYELYRVSTLYIQCRRQNSNDLRLCSTKSFKESCNSHVSFHASMHDHPFSGRNE